MCRKRNDPRSFSFAITTSGRQVVFWPPDRASKFLLTNHPQEAVRPALISPSGDIADAGTPGGQAVSGSHEPSEGWHLEDEFRDYPIGIEPNPSGGWVVMNGDTWRPIAVRNYRPAAEAICRKANGIQLLAGDEFLLTLDPYGNEYGPYYKEPTCVVL